MMTLMEDIEMVGSDEEAEEVGATMEEEVRPGSLVLAALGGWGWWPGLVDQDPETGEFTRVKKGLRMLRVVFVEKYPTKAWVAKEKVIKFTGNEEEEDKDPERMEAYAKARTMVELEGEARLERFWGSLANCPCMQQGFLCGSSCGCPLPCPNSPPALGGTEVRRSGVEGVGCFATRAFARGELVGEYLGRVRGRVLPPGGSK